MTQDSGSPPVGSPARPGGGKRWISGRLARSPVVWLVVVGLVCGTVAVFCWPASGSVDGDKQAPGAEEADKGGGGGATSQPASRPTRSAAISTDVEAPVLADEQVGGRELRSESMAAGGRPDAPTIRYAARTPSWIVYSSLVSASAGP